MNPQSRKKGTLLVDPPKDHVWIGIDNSERGSVKVTWLGPEAHKDLWPGDMRRFSNLPEFQDYWKSEIEDQGGVYFVATANPELDPFSVISWVEAQEEAIFERFCVDEVVLAFQSQADSRNIPGTYRKSYVLALAALHRSRSWRFAQMVLNRACDLQTQLSQLQDSLSQLVVTLPSPHSFNLPF